MLPHCDQTQSPPRKWKPKAAGGAAPPSSSAAAAERMTLASQPAAQLWVPPGNATYTGAASASSSSAAAAEQGVASEKLSKVIKGAPDFAVDNSTFTEAQIRAAFYPKFENEKSDQDMRSRMIEMVSHGLAMEVTLKHSGSLFMYADHRGGAHAKNSFGNVYADLDVSVLGHLFCEAWGKEAPKMQEEFNDFLEENHICILMKLVIVVSGDHGRRPKDDYAIVTDVMELGHGEPKFYSTAEVIAFCLKWRLPMDYVWLFSTRKSAASYFAAYDALCKEGIATPVCKALDEIADISIPGSKDHAKVQGEILEGLVAHIVSRESSAQMEEVLRNFPQPALDGDPDGFQLPLVIVPPVQLADGEFEEAPGDIQEQGIDKTDCDGGRILSPTMPFELGREYQELEEDSGDYPEDGEGTWDYIDSEDQEMEFAPGESWPPNVKRRIANLKPDCEPDGFQLPLLTVRPVQLADGEFEEAPGDIQEQGKGIDDYMKADCDEGRILSPTMPFELSREYQELEENSPEVVDGIWYYLESEDEEMDYVMVEFVPRESSPPNVKQRIANLKPDDDPDGFQLPLVIVPPVQLADGEFEEAPGDIQEQGKGIDDFMKTDCDEGRILSPTMPFELSQEYQELEEDSGDYPKDEEDTNLEDQEMEFAPGENLPPNVEQMIANLKPDGGKPGNLQALPWCCPQCKKRYPGKRSFICDTQKYKCFGCNIKNPTSHSWSMTRVKLNRVLLDFSVTYNQRNTDHCTLYSFLALCDMKRRIRGAKLGGVEATAFDHRALLELYEADAGFEMGHPPPTLRYTREGQHKTIEILLEIAVRYGVPYVTTLFEKQHGPPPNIVQGVRLPLRSLKVSSWFNIKQGNISYIVRLLGQGIPLMAVVPIGKCFRYLPCGPIYHAPLPKDSYSCSCNTWFWSCMPGM